MPPIEGESMNRDRTVFVPEHAGDSVLPNRDFFARLLRHAYDNRTAIKDLNTQDEKSYADLLSDTLSLRNLLARRLSSETIEQIKGGKDVFIGILAEGGYEYSVAMLAVLALGAAVVPMTVALPVEEALYFVRKSRQVAIVCSTKALQLGQAIGARLSDVDSTPPIPCFAVRSSLPKTPEFPATSILVSSNQVPPVNKTAVVMFTSGTTGPPKGSAKRFSFLSGPPLEFIDHYGITAEDTILHILPVHHATGIGVNFIPFLLAGACIEFRFGPFSAEWTWNRWREGGISFFSGVPTIYMRMMRYYENTIVKLSPQDCEAFESGARNIKFMLCGTTALPQPLQEFWTKLRGNRQVLTRYGSSELQAIFKVSADSTGTPDGSVGVLAPGIDVKLSEGDEGEILAKSPWMFCKYIFDDEATAAAHDENGYFKTGDIARREGKYYFILGRASQDIIKSGGYKISALDIEREVLGLPYIEEVMVVPVSDEEYGQRVAAAVSLRDGSKNLSLDKLRDDLRARLASYKMPTLLRVIEGELPKGGSGKVLKKTLGPELFPCPGWENTPEVQRWNRRESKL